MGMTFVPVNAIALMFSVELTYPVSETMSNSLMMVLSQLLCIATTYWVTYLGEINVRYMNSWYALSYIPVLVVNAFIIEDLRRSEFSKKIQTEEEIEAINLEHQHF